MEDQEEKRLQRDSSLQNFHGLHSIVEHPSELGPIHDHAMIFFSDLPESSLVSPPNMHSC